MTVAISTLHDSCLSHTSIQAGYLGSRPSANLILPWSRRIAIKEVAGIVHLTTLVSAMNRPPSDAVEGGCRVKAVARLVHLTTAALES
jgi:hypothetical protein